MSECVIILPPWYILVIRPVVSEVSWTGDEDDLLGAGIMSSSCAELAGWWWPAAPLVLVGWLTYLLMSQSVGRGRPRWQTVTQISPLSQCSSARQRERPDSSFNLLLCWPAVATISPYWQDTPTTAGTQHLSPPPLPPPSCYKYSPQSSHISRISLSTRTRVFLWNSWDLAEVSPVFPWLSWK